MALFKTDEEKRIEEERKLKEEEKYIWEKRRFYGKVGQIHQGLSTFGLWGVRDNGKAKFKSTRFDIYDDKILIDRNKQIVQFSQIKEIFEDESLVYEVILILVNDTGIPIRGSNKSASGRRELKAFVNVLNKMIGGNKPDDVNVGENVNFEENSVDKFDKLIKLGEMYENGFLTDEEFALLKQELMVGSNEDTNENFEDNDEPLENSCENCGADISSDSVFCTECGTKLN